MKIGALFGLTKSFNVSFKLTKKVVEGTANCKSPQDLAERARKPTVMDTTWPDIVSEFCLTKPICREAPGESVSVGYGKRSEKFIRQFSIAQIFKLFKLKYPDFNYELTTFRKLVPANLVKPSMQDVKQNTCPLHENVKRCIRAFNRFARRNKANNLIIPKSTIDICLELICNPDKSNADTNRDPLNWKPDCTKGNCDKCNGAKWFSDLEQKLLDCNLDEKDISYSQWKRIKDGKKSHQILQQEKCGVVAFVQEVLVEALLKRKFTKTSFAEHLRKAWNQWQITKSAIVFDGNEDEVAIRTREDFQEDLKFLCTSETVSTHRGTGVVKMLCYPVVIEIFFKNGYKELHGVIFLSDSKNKNFDTVRHFQNRCVDYVSDLGYKVKRYDRITDGCSSQFWCYGSMWHLESMPLALDVDTVSFHRYEPYEGKNFSDALGSILKRKMRQGALENKKYGNGEEGMLQILEEADDNTDMEDLVFEDVDGAFEWLEMVMEKPDDDKFSKSFNKIVLFWVPKEEIPKDMVDKSVCHKIPGIKNYNMAMALKSKPGVYVRDTSCYNCENCKRGDMLSCVSVVHGAWKNYQIAKAVRDNENLEVSDDELTDEEDFVSCDEDSSDEESDDEMEILSNTASVCVGRFVLYQFMPKKFYVGSVVGQTETDKSVRLMRRYGMANNKVTFLWPDIDDIVVVDNSDGALKGLPNPALNRRGTSVTLHTRAFGKIPTGYIY